ncbi:DedA family protein [Cohnella candidum]|uniref:DedA family protein n=1 Tax=Cohnella candidum TaxID=2674991 RepID=A0A3G3K712_9BACL|nr:DedA family protein [Cohnella candidum]AYQ75539.1 DedA family protein [Cohnella candidum]
MDRLTEFIQSLIDHLGILGIGFSMLLESACIPLPSEVIMLVGGFQVSRGNFGFLEIVAAGVIGNLFGSIVAYAVGYAGGRTFIQRFGKYVRLHERHLEKAEQWFQNYGEWTVLVTRNLPFIRTFISLPAGIAKMNFFRFTIFTALGCIPWNLALTYAGFRLGENWNEAEPYIRPFSYLVAAIILLLIVRWVWKSRKR